MSDTITTHFDGGYRRKDGQRIVARVVWSLDPRPTVVEVTPTTTVAEGCVVTTTMKLKDLEALLKRAAPFDVSPWVPAPPAE